MRICTSLRAKGSNTRKNNNKKKRGNRKRRKNIGKIGKTGGGGEKKNERDGVGRKRERREAAESNREGKI